MKDKLKEFTANFWLINASEIKGALILNDINLRGMDSLRFFEFIAEIEKKFNKRIENINEIKTFQDLTQALK